MKDLVMIMRGDAVVSSRQIAEHFRKNHFHVLRDIKNLIGGISKIGETPTAKMFYKSTYIEEQNGEEYPMYYMNRDGFSLLVMGFTGKKALEWKLKYIAAFNAMEKLLAERQTLDWQQARQFGKVSRRQATDAIKAIVEYATQQGSEHADKYYTLYTKLAHKTAGITSRDDASFEQLIILNETENIIKNAIFQGVVAEKPYKEIYQDCKSRLIQYSELAFLKGRLEGFAANADPM